MHHVSDTFSSLVRMIPTWDTTTPTLPPHPLAALQKQYVFIHDALLEYLNIRGHEMPVKELRKKYQHLKEENPETGQDGIVAEYAVSAYGCASGHK